MATPTDHKKIKEEVIIWLATIKSNILKIIIKTIVLSLFCSLIIGLTCWALGDFNMKHFKCGAPVGVLYFLLAVFECGCTEKRKWNEPSPALIKANRADLLFEKYGQIFFILFYGPVFYLFLSTYKRGGEFFGYWVGMAYFFGMVTFANFIFLVWTRKARKIRAMSDVKNDKDC